MNVLLHCMEKSGMDIVLNFTFTSYTEEQLFHICNNMREVK